MIKFKVKLVKINSWLILHVPANESLKLPSRGMVMVSGKINGSPFKTVLEPDGKLSHWFRVDEKVIKDLNLDEKSIVEIELEPTKEWVEPEVPDDLKEALNASPKAKALWLDITPNARWDWIRWVRAVKTPETRQKHIQVALSKLNKGMRRPCCFNRNLCSDPYVAKNWVLLDASV